MSFIASNTFFRGIKKNENFKVISKTKDAKINTSILQDSKKYYVGVEDHEVGNSYFFPTEENAGHTLNLYG